LRSLLEKAQTLGRTVTRSYAAAAGDRRRAHFPRPRNGVQPRMAQPTEKRKQSLYFPDEMLREIQEEATRQDRSLSWIMQQAWRSARAQIAKMPGMEDLGPIAKA
jgi:uncharacterized small protein (TIGR04563 family)